MKPMTNPKIATFIIICGLSAVLAAPNVEGRSSSLKKAPAPTAASAQPGGFFGTFTPPQEVKRNKKAAKEDSGQSSPKAVPSSSVPEEKTEKSSWNPFSGLFGKKKSENEVPLPSERAVPSSNLNAGGETPANPPTIPSPESGMNPGVPVSEAAPQTEEFTADSPQIILDAEETSPEVNPVLESSPVALVSTVPEQAERRPEQEPLVEAAETNPQMEQDLAGNVLSEIGEAPETPEAAPEVTPEVGNEVVSGEAEDEMPLVPQTVTPAQVDPTVESPEVGVSVSGLGISECGNLVPQDSVPKIPELEFMETNQRAPILNVSPQRLVSPAEKGFGPSKTSRSDFPSGNEVSEMESIPSMREVEIGQRFGHEVTLGDSAKNRAELKIRTHIPENMLVGVQTEITVEILNASTVSSEGSVVEISIPDWFQVIKVTPGKGEANFTPSESSVGQHCVWNVGTILPNTRETMVLCVIPEKKNAANVQVSWSNMQFAEHQTVVSEEPEIQLRMLGPKNIQEGKETQLNILVRNTGTCTVHEIAILCEAVGCKNQKYFIPGIQTLLPGEEKSVELNITPASREGVTLHVEALIKNRCFCKTDYDLNVNYVDFQIRVPEQEKFIVGMDSHLPLVISNEGNTPAEGCRLCIELPPQLRFTGQTLNQVEKDPITGLTTLRIDEMDPGENRNLVLDLHCIEEGEIELPVGVLLKSRTVAEKKIPLTLEGIASAEMKLCLPKRVLVCAETGEYEIQIMNSGTRKIEDGKLVVYFSEGFEPVNTNQNGEIQNGGIVTYEIPVLVPGESQTFRIQAESTIPGNHAIRCELKSDEHQLNLIQQETVIFR